MFGSTLKEDDLRHFFGRSLFDLRFTNLVRQEYIESKSGSSSEARPEKGLIRDAARTHDIRAIDLTLKLHVCSSFRDHDRVAGTRKVVTGRAYFGELPEAYEAEGAV